MKTFKNIYPLAVIMLLITAVYFNTLKNAFQYDDIIYILNSERIRAIPPLSEIVTNIFSRPLLFITFALDYFIGGSSTVGYHIVNIVLHIFVCMLIYVILLHILRQDIKYRHYPLRLIPFISSLIFALNPVNTESVTYIISRSSILSAFFYLLSLLMFIKGNKKRGKGQEINTSSLYFSSVFRLLASGFCFILAIASKEDAVTLPIIILFYYLFFAAGTDVYKNIRIVLFFIIIASIYPILRYLKFGMIGTGEAAGVYTAFTYLLTEFNVIIFYYLKLLFIPINLNVDPDIRPAASVFDISTLLAILIIFLIIIAAFRFFKKDKIVSFSIVWFFVALLPTSSIFPLWDAAAEHRVYLPAIGFSIFSALLIARIRLRYKYLTTCLFIGILMSFSLCTIKRNFVWKDRVSLWEDAVKKSPSKARPHAALGLAYNQEKGLADEAVRQYRIALGIKPFYFDALNNMGVALAIKGDMEGAMQKYELALLIKPNSPELYNNIAIIYAKRGEMDKAIAYFKKALDIAPGYRHARKNLEIALDGRTDFEGSPSVDSLR